MLRDVRRYHEKMRLREKNRMEDLRNKGSEMRNEGGVEGLVESRKTEKEREGGKMKCEGVDDKKMLSRHLSVLSKCGH